MRPQLQDYVKKATPGTGIAVLGLTNRLVFLQGFTSGPAILKDVVTNRLTQNAPSLLTDPTGSTSDSSSTAAGAASAGVAPGQVLSQPAGLRGQA